MDTLEKLTILANAAKYDVSCASSGVSRKNSGGTGNTASFGICHSWSADGRCISLLKVLVSNDCVFDCRYCGNRKSNPVTRASFSARELADLTMQFYRRNYIEGLFLSSAVERSADQTMEKMLETLRLLRHDYRFHGYIHVKAIPGAQARLLEQAGFLADRMSVNIEQPSEESLRLLAPQKTMASLLEPMKLLSEGIAARGKFSGRSVGSHLSGSPSSDNLLSGNKDIPLLSTTAPDGTMVIHDSGETFLSQSLPTQRAGGKPRFLPGGQSTQMIVGASQDSDLTILRTTQSLYQAFKLKRVYFSAYVPVNNDSLLPALSAAPPLRREHRLYQSDWLLRFYHFRAEEIVDPAHPNLETDIDPKTAWALRHPEFFPVEINKASLEELLRVPGIGPVSAGRIARQRRLAALNTDTLLKVGIVWKRARYFITCQGRYGGDKEMDMQAIRAKIAPIEPVQPRLF
ncbi:MAG: putative DNA modification/repair radical SAM protein [Peptococcaceae bacterium]|nr:putative DNA modification/repair radical SAM protein [Peptococcaceae bacterium]